ncbi:MAG: hypothetical protein KC547_22375 [Anaerolineae bacterium]|nr:hypothetical protein [Anaerolineae bacterium]
MFEFRTSAPVDIVAQQLQELQRPRTSIFQVRSTKVVIMPRHDGSVDFDICAQRRGKSGDGTIVHAAGSLTIDPITGETIISGAVKPSYPRLILLIFSAVTANIFIAAVSSRRSYVEVLPMILMVAAFFALAAYIIWKDWRDLENAIETVMEKLAIPDSD